MRGPAQRALTALLRAAFEDEARATLAMRDALTSSGLSAVPEESHALLSFVRDHVAHRLAEELGPRMAQALIEELRVALEADPSWPKPVQSVVPARDKAAASTLPSPPKAQPLRASPTLMSGMREGSVGWTVTATHKPRVLLWEPNRLLRSTLARSLVGARCDVVAPDEKGALRDALAATDSLQALIIDADETALAELLLLVTTHRPDLPVVVWTDRPAPAIAAICAKARIVRCAIVAKDTSTPDVIQAARRLGG